MACRGAWRPGSRARPLAAAPDSAQPARRLSAAPSTSAGSRKPRSCARASRGSPRVAARPRPRALSARRSRGGSTRTPTRPGSHRWARPRSARGADRHTRSPRSVRVELLGKKHRRALEDLIRAAQLLVLPTQPSDLLALLRREHLTTRAAVGLRLAHALTQRLMMDTQISSHPRDRPPGLKHKPDAALHQLIGILPRSWHKHGVPLSRTEILVSRPPRNPAYLSGRHLSKRASRRAARDVNASVLRTAQKGRAHGRAPSLQKVALYSLRVAIGGIGPLVSIPFTPATDPMNHLSNSSSDDAAFAKKLSAPGPSVMTSTRKPPSGVGCRYARCSVNPWRAFISSNAAFRGPFNSATQASHASSLSAASGIAIPGILPHPSLQDLRIATLSPTRPRSPGGRHRRDHLYSPGRRGRLSARAVHRRLGTPSRLNNGAGLAHARSPP